MKAYEYSDGIHHAHICANAKAISVYMETSFDADTIKQADRIIRNHGFLPVDEPTGVKELSYIQFNVWYYDFEYNDKRVRTFSRIENATQFVTSLVNDSKHRFIELESVY